MTENDEKKLVDRIESIAFSLEKLTLLKAIDSFYSPAERMHLVADHRALYEADGASFENLTKARSTVENPGLGWENRVEKYGETEARRQNEPFMAAMEARRVTLRNIDEFEKTHPLICELRRLYPSVADRKPNGN